MNTFWWIDFHDLIVDNMNFILLFQIFMQNQEIFLTITNSQFQGKLYYNVTMHATL